MWLNLKPYTTHAYDRKHIRYLIGITGQNDLVDQHRNVIKIMPGQKTVINVIPRLVRTSEDFNALKLKQRNCKLYDETEGQQFLTTYSRKGCETECAIQKAMSMCKCIPWHIPNDFNKLPPCEMFGGYCFDLIMSDERNYVTCKYNCLRECHETFYIVLPVNLPIDFKTVCNENSFHYQHFQHDFRRHFAYENYKTLVVKGVVPDLAASLSNGSLCKDYVRNYAAFVSVGSPSTAAILTERDKSFFVYDVISSVGGHFGLFTGMSMLSIAEVVIFLVSLLYQIWKTCRELCQNDNYLKSLILSDSKDQFINDQIQRMENFIKVGNPVYFSIYLSKN